MPKQKPPSKSPLLAAILSFFIPGIGQWYKGENKWAFLMFIGGFLSMALGPLIVIYRLAAAWDGYTGRIADVYYGRKEEPAPKRAQKKAPAKKVPVKRKPKKKLKVSKPKAPGLESHEKMLVRTLLDLVQDNDYYRVKVITNKMAERYPSEQDWLNTRWVGRSLKELGFTEKRHMRKGNEVRLSPASVRKVARKYKVLV
ncbi:hypothetical protein ACFLQI_03235 [Candidatus Undinarchaeota archaeon]